MADQRETAVAKVQHLVLEAGDDPGRRRAAVLAVAASDIEALLHAQFSGESDPVAVGLGASPGAAVGQVCFSADDAVEAFDAGTDVILVKEETTPADVHGMAIAEGILTTRGGLASHAAVVARGWGKPAVCGVEAIALGAAQFEVGGHTVRVGDVISIDGASGEVFLGEVDRSDGAAEDDVPDELGVLLGWADEARAGTLAVRANADNADDACRALSFGAEGIGLCRTEHQFLGERLPLIRQFILAKTDEDEARALAALTDVQRQDFLALFEAMDGLPVTVRLLDPPLHEFLPDIEELAVAAVARELTHEDQALLEAGRQWQEANPMLGTRGVRLGILRQGLYQMQVEAILWAAVERRQAGGQPIIEVMVPLIVDRSELDLVRKWIDAEIAKANRLVDDPLDVLVGTMVETPRAALLAGEIANSSDFFSFGTNDLTQMTYGFSRDDVEAKIVPEYLRLELLSVNPFESLDIKGVGALVRAAVEDGRASRPDLKLGICGEHGGDPSSIDFFASVGLDYVSCSPFRVPVARLAAGQAVIRQS